jgi:uncharacterized spore protein YtfJ
MLIASFVWKEITVIVIRARGARLWGLEERTAYHSQLHTYTPIVVNHPKNEKKNKKRITSGITNFIF